MEKKTAGIIVLNGWAASSHAWDLCGFMKTHTHDGESPLLFSYVDQLDAKPEAVFEKGGRFVLAGWSMGGSSALRIACRYPDQVAGLVLIAATPRMMEDKESGWKGMSPRRLEALRKGLELTQGQGFFGVPDDKPNPYMMDAPDNLERGLKYLLETDIRSEIQNAFGEGCPFPVHIFQCEHDGIVRSSNARWLNEVFRDAHLHLEPGSEHAFTINYPELIDQAISSCI